VEGIDRGFILECKLWRLTGGTDVSARLRDSHVKIWTWDLPNTNNFCPTKCGEWNSRWEDAIHKWM